MVENLERRNTFYTDISRINKAFGAYKTTHRMPPAQDEENPRDVLIKSSQSLRAAKPDVYYAYTKAAPLVWTDEVMQAIQTKVGSTSDLPELDIVDPELSINKVTVTMYDITADTVRTTVDPQYARAATNSRKSKYVALHPELEVVEKMFGGASDGADIMAEVLKTVIRNDPFPEPEKVRKILSQSYQAVASMTAMNIVPQTILENVMASGIPILTLDESPGAPEPISLDRTVVNYLITLGESIFTNGTPNDLNASGFEEILAYTQSQFFPTIPESTVKEMSFWFELSDKDVAKNIQWYPQATQKILHEYFSLSHEIYKLFENVITDPADLETIICPANHARILKPWHTMWVNLLSEWYAREYAKINA